MNVSYTLMTYARL